MEKGHQLWCTSPLCRSLTLFKCVCVCVIRLRSFRLHLSLEKSKFFFISPASKQAARTAPVCVTNSAEQESVFELSIGRAINFERIYFEWPNFDKGEQILASIKKRNYFDLEVYSSQLTFGPYG